MRFLFLALLLVGCTPRTIVKTQTVEVPVYVQTHIDAGLLRRCLVTEPQPACNSRFCNGQLAEMIVTYRSALAQCDADKQAIERAQK